MGGGALCRAQVGRKPELLGPTFPCFLMLELLFFILKSFFIGMHGSERTRVSDGVGNRGSGGEYNSEL